MKNPETKEHPCFVPYDELPEAQKAKDAIFGAVVRGVLAHHGVLPVAQADVTEKKFRITGVKFVRNVEPTGGDGWRIELEGSRGSEFPNSLCDVAPQVGEEAVFTFPKGCDRGSLAIGGRLYVEAS